MRTDAPLFSDVETLRWRGVTDAFAHKAEQMNVGGGTGEQDAEIAKAGIQELLTRLKK